MSAVVVAAASLLVGCSAHPGAGTWQLEEGQQSPFSRLIVHFEGRAELFDAVSGVETHHCFWAGRSDTEIQLDCTTPEDTETPIRFNLRVSGGERAQLSQAGQVLGEYQRVVE